MNQHDFDKLLQKYLSGNCNPEEEERILEWSDHLIVNTKASLTGKEQKAVEKRIWKRIRGSVISKPSSITYLRRSAMGIAASFLLICAFTAIFPKLKDQFRSNVSSKAAVGVPGVVLVKDYIEIKNTSGRSKTLSLEDGTQITLAKESSMKYPAHFNGKTRQVVLEGEAVFNVKRDVSRPFFVYTGELVTQVLGTSFKIRSFESSRTIEVQVLTGRVSVYENRQKSPQNRNGVILRPNQKITFDKQSKKLVPELVEVPAMVEVPDEDLPFSFEESSLSEVLGTIQKAYDIEIVVENPALNNCGFTGDITGLPLHTQLRFICKSVNAGYESRGTTFFIHGDGCK